MQDAENRINAALTWHLCIATCHLANVLCILVFVIICRTDLLCGEKLYDRGLQRLEAMLYAVDRFAIPMKIIYINELYLIIPTQSLNSVLTTFYLA